MSPPGGVIRIPGATPRIMTSQAELGNNLAELKELRQQLSRADESRQEAELSEVACNKLQVRSL